MNRHERGLEFKVGIFVFVGLAMLGALLVQFGRLGEGFKAYYPLTVRFTNASGLLKGSDVLLAGARIGSVAGGPRLVREGGGVAVPLKIYDYVKIPLGSKFTVGSTGLLGDRFVTVTPPQGPPTGYVAKNAFVDTRKVIRTATQGKGLVATLLNNQELANDLHALISNLRAHGVLFYRDTVATTQAKAPEQTKPTRQTKSR